MKDLSPELTSNTHYRTLKWLQCLYFSVHIKDQGQQQPQSAFQRLALGECAYAEVPVAERDELSGTVAWSIHH